MRLGQPLFTVCLQDLIVFGYLLYIDIYTCDIYIYTCYKKWFGCVLACVDHVVAGTSDFVVFLPARLFLQILECFVVLTILADRRLLWICCLRFGVKMRQEDEQIR